MSLFFSIYIISVVVSFLVSLYTYRSGMPLYKFSFGEKLIGLMIVPMIPIFNLIMVYLLLKD